MAETKKGHGEHTGNAAEETREAAERALRGEHDPVPASDLKDGGHVKSHAAHLEAPPQHLKKENAQDKPEGNLRQGSYPGGMREP
jgi:hypothetical protein